MSPRETRYLRVLVDSGVISFKAAAALEEASQVAVAEAGTSRPVWDLAIEKGLLTPEQSAEALRQIEDDERSSSSASASGTTSGAGRKAKEETGNLHRQLGGYELISKLGQGGMGAVYKARQANMDRLVALKVLPRSLARNEEFIKRFLREARAAGRLSHPNIVAGIDAGCADGFYYFAMEYVEGCTLADMLHEHGPLAETSVAEFGRQVASALNHAHEMGLVHRDIKPENILIDGAGQAKLCDLGLARGANEDMRLTQVGHTVGTPYYMAPEQACGEPPDLRSDIYSLGCTLYHLVTGRPPFDGDNPLQIIQKHINEIAPRASEVRPGISSAFDAVLAKMMAQEASARYQSADEVVGEFDKVLSGGVPAALAKSMADRRRAGSHGASGTRSRGTRSTRRISARREAVASPSHSTVATLPTARPVGGRRRMALIAAAALLTLSGGVAGFVWGMRDDSSPAAPVPLPPPESGGTAVEDNLAKLAERFAAVEAYEKDQPRKYAEVADLYTALVKDGAGTEIAARARQALVDLAARREADVSADRLAELSRKLGEVEAFGRAQPEGYAELLRRYDLLARNAAGTAIESQARSAAEAVERRRAARAAELLGGLRARVAAASSRADFGAALAAIDAFPAACAPAVEKDLASLRDKTLADGRARWDAILAESRRLVADKRFDEADAAVARGRKLGIPGLEAAATAAQGEVAAARKAEDDLRLAATRDAYRRFSDSFAKLLAADDYGAIREEAGRLAGALPPDLDAQLRADLDLVAGAEGFAKELRAALGRRGLGAFRINTPMGPASFQSFEAGKDSLILKSLEAGLAVDFPFELRRLDRAEQVRIMGALADPSGKGRMPAEMSRKAACFLLASGRAEGVKELLAAARTGAVDLGDLPVRLEVLEKGAVEVEAERLLAEFDRLFKAESWGPTVAAGERLQKEFGETRAVKSRAEELAGLLERARHNGSPLARYELSFRQGEPIPELKIEAYAGTTDTGLAAIDADLANSKERGCGGADTLGIFPPSGQNKEGRGVIRFDLAGVPQDAKIEKAVLRLMGHSPQDMKIGAYRLTSLWQPSKGPFEYDAGASWTWAVRSGSERKAWATPGGDIDTTTDWGQGPNGLLCKPVPNVWNGVVEIDLTALAQSWVSGKLPNYGVLIKTEEPKSIDHKVWAGYDASEHREPGRRPTLVLTITCPKLQGR